MKTLRTLLCLVASLGFLAVASDAGAQTINWGSTASTTFAGNKHFLSDGSSMPDGFTFQLGYFDAGFNASDPTSWVSNWHVYDDGSSGGIEGQDDFNNPISPSPFGYNFAASTTNTLPAFDGQQGYIWGFNDQGLTGLFGGEAVLITNPGWLFPATGSLVAVDWTVSLATDVVWGSIDTNGSTGGGYIDGGGVQSAPQAADGFHVQTATFAPVPEPGSMLLLSSAGFAFLLRRRRVA